MKFVSRSSNKEEGKTHKGKIPPSNEGAYKTIAKAAKNGMTRQFVCMRDPVALPKAMGFCRARALHPHSLVKKISHWH